MTNGLTTACLTVLDRLSTIASKHPKRITAAIATLLLTAGGGAFAVANLAPDASDLPVRTVAYPVESLASDTPLTALLDIPSYSLYRTDQTRANDSAESILQRMGVADRPPPPSCAATTWCARTCWAAEAAR